PAGDGIRDFHVTGVQTCALPIYYRRSTPTAGLEHTTHVPDSDHWFGQWPTAGDMEHGWRTARWAILRYYKRLVEHLDETGHLLEIGRASGRGRVDIAALAGASKR